MRFTDKERKAVAAAIAKAEKKTSGEIFCVAARASDDYRYIPLMWAALLALFVPLPLIVFTLLSVQVIFAAQLGVFLVCALATLWPPLRFALVPGRVKHARARRNAIEQFLAHGLHTTERRTGVLIFLSEAERHGEVIADENIYRKVDASVWDEAVEALVAAAGRGEAAEGFVAAVERCGAVLAAHFPPGKGGKNELSNSLVEL